jgi:hypothetical protein
MITSRDSNGRILPKKAEDKRFKANGYIYVWFPNHPRARKNYVAEHILIAEQKLGRPLKEDEIAHHINQSRDDNRIENIEVMTKEQHNRHHNPKTERTNYSGKWKSHKLDFCCCGKRKDIRAKNCRTCAGKIRRVIPDEEEDTLNYEDIR